MAGTAMLGLQFLFPGLMQDFELKLIDNRFEVRQGLGLAPAFSSRIAHVNIDNYSKTESGQPIWEKQTYAALIEKITSARPEAIACDIMFVDWVEKSGNEELVQATINAGNLVSPFLLDTNPGGTKAPDALGLDANPRLNPGAAPAASGILVTPFDALMEQSAGLGFANMSPDPDGIIRRVPAVMELEGTLVPSLFLQAVATQLDYDLEEIEIIDQSRIVLRNFPAHGEDALGDLEIPLDGRGNLLVNYAGPLELAVYPESYSAWNLLTADTTADFSGKLVFLANTSSQATEFGDASPTPVASIFPRAYIWANAANMLLTDKFITPLPYVFAIAAVLVLGALLVLSAWRLAALWFSVTSMGMLLLYLGLSFSVFAIGGYLLPVLPVLVPLLVLYLFSSVYRYVQLEHYEGVLEGSLQSYLSPRLMDQIRANPDILKLGGARKRITVMFSDLVDFTAFSDRADPEEVQDVLETYFANSATAIFSQDGVVDKYMGDGILAFFENDGDQITSATRAVDCALTMQARAHELNELYRSQNRSSFAIRVGLTTGYAKVGNIGPAEKIDYTVIGSVVNLASRLQGVAKPGDIVIDEDTCFFVKDRYLVTDLGPKDLKGFSNPIAVFSVTVGEQPTAG
ncbi:MAG: adenylate/guanylate cyclase domain-containing protein [Proteobacteria bacterium]|nr:adenylate/guanylate cyclase domain-containing protein [Pseudomonadota bacterium]